MGPLCIAGYLILLGFFATPVGSHPPPRILGTPSSRELHNDASRFAELVKRENGGNRSERRAAEVCEHSTFTVLVCTSERAPTVP
jgi:hypothetical protein